MQKQKSLIHITQNSCRTWRIVVYVDGSFLSQDSQ